MHPSPAPSPRPATHFPLAFSSAIFCATLWRAAAAAQGGRGRGRALVACRPRTPRTSPCLPAARPSRACMVLLVESIKCVLLRARVACAQAAAAARAPPPARGPLRIAISPALINSHSFEFDPSLSCPAVLLILHAHALHARPQYLRARSPNSPAVLAQCRELRRMACSTERFGTPAP